MPRTIWQPVSRSQDLAPGTVRPLTLLGERFALFRTRAGRPGLLQTACPHRGTALHLGRVVEEALVCMHHGWGFGVNGGCTVRPDQGDPHRCRVSAPIVREHLGLVFAWFGAGEPSALPRWPAFEVPGTLRVLPPEIWPCPFFLRLENSLDMAHLPSTHHDSGVGALVGAPRPPRVEVLPDGLRVEGDSEAPVPLEVRLLLPNALCFPTPVSPAAGWRDHLVWRVPVDDDHCLSFTLTHIPADVPGAADLAHTEPLARPLDGSRVHELGDRVLRGEIPLASLQGEPNLTEIEDYVALCGVERDALGAPRAGEQLGPHDGPVRALRRRWEQALRGEARLWAGAPAVEEGPTTTRGG